MKARFQQRYEPGSPMPYTGLWDCCVKIFKREGFTGYYKGFTANILRVAPQSAVTLLAYEHIKALLE